MNATQMALILLSTWSWGAVAPEDQPFKADSVLITLIDQAEVAAQEPGVLAQIAIREGQMVAAGELLAQVDDAAAQIARRRAKTERDIAAKEAGNNIKVRYAKDTLATAKAEFQRATHRSKNTARASPDRKSINSGWRSNKPLTMSSKPNTIWPSPS